MMATHRGADAPRTTARGWAPGSWLLAFGLILLAAAADATVIAPAELSDVVSGSHAIVHGRVIAVRSTTTSDRRSIFSLVTLSVDEALKGRPGQTVTFRVPNGQVGRYRRIVVGAPEFAVGDEVVVFLHGAAPRMPTLFGLSQGVYRVVRDSVSRRLASETFIRRVRAMTERAR